MAVLKKTPVKKVAAKKVVARGTGSKTTKAVAPRKARVASVGSVKKAAVKKTARKVAPSPRAPREVGEFGFAVGTARDVAANVLVGEHLTRKAADEAARVAVMKKCKMDEKSARAAVYQTVLALKKTGYKESGTWTLTKAAKAATRRATKPRPTQESKAA